MNFQEILQNRVKSIESHYSRLLNEHGNNPLVEIEIEARFHEYFQQGLSLSTFTRLRNSSLLANLIPALEYSQDYIYPDNIPQFKDIRLRIINLQQPNQRIIVLRKQSHPEREDYIPEFKDLYDKYRIKFSINTETMLYNNYSGPEPQQNSYSIRRDKIRYSYSVIPGIKLDLTDVTEYDNKNNKINQRYEAEMEFDRKIISEQYYINAIFTVWQIIHETRDIYSKQEYENTITFINLILDPTVRSSLNFNHTTTISSRPLFQMRNLHYEDLVSPGIINATINSKVSNNVKTLSTEQSIEIANKSNQYDIISVSYRITHKTDGERKLLVFTEHGIYLVSAPHSVNKIAGPHPSLVGTIIEGEFIPKDKRRAAAPQANIWFLIYDCLSYTMDINKNYYSNFVNDQNLNNVSKNILSLVNQDRNLATSIQEMDHGNRILACNNIKNLLLEANPIGDSYIEVKEFGAACITAEDIFNRILRLETELNEIQYQTDGYIFMPFETPYKQTILYNNKIIRPDWLSLSNRQLSVFPDVMKWKPTITIDLRYVYDMNSVSNVSITIPESLSEPSRIETISVPSKYDLLFSLKQNDIAINIRRLLDDKFYEHINKLYPDEDVFRGTFIEPITKIEIDFSKLLLSNIASGTVIEVQYDLDSKKFIPIKIRGDKPKPNNKEFAEDNWKMITNPIDISTLTGRGVKLMRKYHNRIKADLFNYPIYDILNKHPEKKTIELKLLDLGSGNFGDVTKMNKYSKIILVEPNADYIKEGILRIKKFYDYEPNIITENDTREVIFNKISQALKMFTNNNKHKILVINSRAENTKLISNVVDGYFNGKADVISMMLSMTFFWNKESFIPFMNTIQTNIVSNGKIIFLTMDGNNVFQKYKDAVMSDNLVKIIHFGEGLHDQGMQVAVNRHKLYIDLQTPTVNSQSENFVFLDDMRIQLIKNKFVLRELYTCDSEKFLNRHESALSELYSYGIFGLHSEIKIFPFISLGKDSSVKIFKQTEGITQIEEIGRVTDILEKINLEDVVINTNLISDEDFADINKRNISDIQVKQQQNFLDFQSPILEDVNLQSFLNFSNVQTGTPELPKTAEQGKEEVSFEVKEQMIGVSKFGELETIPGEIYDYVDFTPEVIVVPEIKSGTFSGLELGQKKVDKSQTSFLSTLPGSESGKFQFGTQSGFGTQQATGFGTQNIITTISNPAFPIARVALPMLSVSGSGDGDDVKQRIVVKKYPSGNIVRIATIPDGSCLIHSALKSFLPEYLESNNQMRKNIVKNFRREMAARLMIKTDGKMFYETFMDGVWLSLAVQQYIGEIRKEPPMEFNSSLKGLQDKFLSDGYLGDEIFNYLSYIIGLKIIIVKGYTDDIEFVVETEDFNYDKCIVILGNGAHYELVAEIINGQTKTVFQINDPFIVSIRNK